ncbi:MAG: hypothetical protein M3256_27580 [Actinomycetota bacterium]|nr:hypothetical protein [Actinomycetota bacterium]
MRKVLHLLAALVIVSVVVVPWNGRGAVAASATAAPVPTPDDLVVGAPISLPASLHTATPSDHRI